jgi:phosphatidylglycerophosphate synthase
VIENDPGNRRPLKSRGTGWARSLAAALARMGVSPDLVSAFSLVFAIVGAAAFLGSAVAEGWQRPALLIAAGTCIQLRLLCNLLDGMVAVEHGRAGPLGPIWNELPDRVADVLFLVGAGYAARCAGIEWADALGWAAAAGALLTAYVRELGRALGHPADFSGPMAKPHRMALLTGACVVSALEGLWGWRGETLAIALAVILVGTLVTTARRTLRLASSLGRQD